MTSTIKSTRLASGVSVNELANRLKVTPSAVSQLERSEAEGTIKLNSLREALAVLNSDLRLTAGPSSSASRYAPYRIADSLAEALILDKNSSYPLRLLTHSAQELSENVSRMDPSELELAPTPLPDRRWDVFMRVELARAMPRDRRPAWTRVEKLVEPWFVSDFPALRERAKSTTPDYLKDLNIFIDERSVTRA